MDYKKENVYWLISNRHKVAQDLSEGKPSATAALLAILENPDGARAFKEMRVKLTSEEWDKLYLICAEDLERLVPSLFTINCLSDEQIVHKNLELRFPAQFAIEPVHDFYMATGHEKFVIEKRLRESFIRRYNEAKVSQPR